MAASVFAPSRKCPSPSTASRIALKAGVTSMPRRVRKMRGCISSSSTNALSDAPSGEAVMPEESQTRLPPASPAASEDSAFSTPSCASKALASVIEEATPDGRPSSMQAGATDTASSP